MFSPQAKRRQFCGPTISHNYAISRSFHGCKYFMFSNCYDYNFNNHFWLYKNTSTLCAIITNWVKLTVLERGWLQIEGNIT